MMRRSIYGVLPLLIAMGCSPRSMTLEEEIATAPDAWSFSWKTGASSNNWALLERVSCVENTHERIRLMTALQNHFKRSVARELDGCAMDNSFQIRMAFLQACAYQLIKDKDPHAVCAGWNLMAIWLDDLENLIVGSEQAWQDGVYDRHASHENKMKWGFASKVRKTYEHYFKYSFNVSDTYNRLPTDVRPVFVKQIKKDFLNRKGLKYIDRREFPREFLE